ncbi:MAG: AMP-binding protein, partial [Acidimicrobiales bacterium]|nr:AMP-binding protein [Acidimicrobiales bacterium]
MATAIKGFAESKPNTPALTDENRQVTWGELNGRVNQLAHALRGAGLNAGDTIAIVSGNRTEWFELTLACAHSGVIFVPVNWHLVAPEMAYIFADSGARLVFAGERYIDTVADALQD